MKFAKPLQRVRIETERRIADYAAVAHLASAVHELQAEAASVLPRLTGRTVWLVSSTARGGGVAEMLPPIVELLRDLGARTEWVVIGTEEPDFFVLTKHLHDLIHGAGTPRLDDDARALFERVNRANADALVPHLRAGDVLVVHDPQPLPLASMLCERIPLTAIWRCHIGLDAENEATRAAWRFLAPYLDAYEIGVFSAPEYIPERMRGKASVIPPGIDPLSSKNMDLSLHHAIEVLCNGALATAPGPLLHPPFTAPARRLLGDGRWLPANETEDIGLLTRPIVTQVSRWDRLKGWLPLMLAFAALKESLGDRRDGIRRRRLELARLVMAGPEPEAIQDDPEGMEVLRELSDAYRALEPSVQRDIALVALPMASVEENALMVNALQRASMLVVQNSLREGFGLTIAEAMWKGVPVLSNAKACGPRQQVRDGLDGRLIADPEDIDALRGAIEEMLGDPEARHRWGRSAQRRVHDQFLVIAQLRRWAQLLAAAPLVG